MEISKEQILDIYGTTGNLYLHSKLTKWFPEAFKVEFEVGKWYYHKKSTALVNYQGGSSGYGFNALDNWCSIPDFIIWTFETRVTDWRLATKEEWESALIAEAKKRGLYDAKSFNHANNLKLNWGYPSFLESISENQIWTKNGCIYSEGVWGEIIKTFSKEEAEKLLGVKII